MSSQQPNPAIAYIRFADWCLNFDSLSEEAKHTVGMLSKRLGTSDCYEIEFADGYKIYSYHGVTLPEK